MLYFALYYFDIYFETKSLKTFLQYFFVYVKNTASNYTF